MFTLVLIGVIGGLITGISPCILPILPAIFVAGTTGNETSHRRRPFAVIAGLVASFSVFTLIGSALLDALHLPQDLLRDIGLAVLVAVGIGLIVPKIGELLERPFSLIPQRQARTDSGGLVLGLGLGLLYVPCAGPVLTAITVASASHHIGANTVALTVAFAIGTAIPLTIFALAGAGVNTRVRAFRNHAPAVRKAGGVVMVLLALALTFNLTDALQRNVPGYTNRLQDAFEGTSSAKGALKTINKQPAATPSSKLLAACGAQTSSTSLMNCGNAPEFTGISQWLNTPNGQPLSIAGLHGKVILIDFWTYSCINCQRTLPHVEAWNTAYAQDGLQIIGVHTPEFAFEHVVSNVTSQSKSLGVTYPVAIDNSYSTWNAYNNEYWPAEYLIDANGVIRHVDFGEGNYGGSEKLIRQLLTQANPSASLPASTTVADTTPTSQSMSPETYLGYSKSQYYAGEPPLVNDKATAYAAPESIPVGSYALGGTWNVGSESAATGANAGLKLNFLASDIYLVLGGQGSVTVSVNGAPPITIPVSGDPRLYTLVSGIHQQQGTLSLQFSPGVDAYSFTFG